MKLNNKGFAITAVLYGLLILFVILVSSYLVVLSVKKDRVEDLVSNIEKEYLEEYTNRCRNINTSLEEGQTYTVPYTGTYIFDITNSNSGQILGNCSASLEKDNIIHFTEGTIKVNDSDISFADQDCGDTIYYKVVESINSITYNCE